MRIDVKITLSYKGKNVTEMFLGDFSKETHTYTAQYSMTASEKLLPKIFLCLRELAGEFGPRYQKYIWKRFSDYI